MIDLLPLYRLATQPEYQCAGYEAACTLEATRPGVLSLFLECSRYRLREPYDIHIPVGTKGCYLGWTGRCDLWTAYFDYFHGYSDVADRLDLGRRPNQMGMARAQTMYQAWLNLVRWQRERPYFGTCWYLLRGNVSDPNHRRSWWSNSTGHHATEPLLWQSLKDCGRERSRGAVPHPDYPRYKTWNHPPSQALLSLLEEVVLVGASEGIENAGHTEVLV